MRTSAATRAPIMSVEGSDHCLARCASVQQEIPCRGSEARQHASRITHVVASRCLPSLRELLAYRGLFVSPARSALGIRDVVDSDGRVVFTGRAIDASAWLASLTA